MSDFFEKTNKRVIHKAPNGDISEEGIDYLLTNKDFFPFVDSDNFEEVKQNILSGEISKKLGYEILSYLNREKIKVDGEQMGKIIQLFKAIPDIGLKRRKVDMGLIFFNRSIFPFVEKSIYIKAINAYGAGERTPNNTFLYLSLANEVGKNKGTIS